MIYYRFKTFTTSYYFPSIPDKDKNYLYGLYSPYGGKLSRIYWWLFRAFRLVRRFTALEEKDLDFPYTIIKENTGKNTLISFNMGSPGLERKISMLGYDYDEAEPFFAKFAQSERAKELSQNEINVLNALSTTSMAPRLLNSKIASEYVFLKTEYVKGNRPNHMELTDYILDLAYQLYPLHLSEEKVSSEGLKLSLAHGDFCPWNMIVCNGEYKLIDWELAEDRVVGFDILTYICQVAILFNPDKSLYDAIKEKEKMIICYFSKCEVVDYIPYLKEFARQKAKYEKRKNNIDVYLKYIDLLSKIEQYEHK